MSGSRDASARDRRGARKIAGAGMIEEPRAHRRDVGDERRRRAARRARAGRCRERSRMPGVAIAPRREHDARGREDRRRAVASRPRAPTTRAVRRRARAARASAAGRAGCRARRTVGRQVAARRAHALAVDLVHRVRADAGRASGSLWSAHAGKPSVGAGVEEARPATARARSAGAGGSGWARPGRATRRRSRGRPRAA